MSRVKIAHTLVLTAAALLCCINSSNNNMRSAWRVCPCRFALTARDAGQVLVLRAALVAVRVVAAV